MRYILAIDTAGAEGSVALAGDGAPLRCEPLPAGGHSEGLSRAAGGLLAESGLLTAGLAALAVAQGPGSFTGLRIGLAWAKGFAWGNSIPLVLVSSHEALALGRGSPGRRVASLIPAGRGRVDAALWSAGPPLALLWGPETVEEDQIVPHLLEIAGVDRREGGARKGAGRPNALQLAPITAVMEAALEEQMESGLASLAPKASLAPAVAAIADRLLLAGQTAELASASPAYGRAPNARKPSP